MKEKKPNSRSFYDAMKRTSHHLVPEEIAKQIQQVDRARVEALASLLSGYLGANLPAAIDRREGLGDYRTNPYVLMASANIMDLGDAESFAAFLFNTKLYMGLETSFGKSVEAAFVGQYPLGPGTTEKWSDPAEKTEESKALRGLTNEKKARQRTESVWREMDKSCIVGDRRYLVSIKSGPNCINDTQVAGMTDAIAKQRDVWMKETRKTYPSVRELDIIIGLTYGTDRTTNNKENQILVKLLSKGFKEEDRRKKPGVLIDKKTRSIRVYRRIGKDFWATIGDPTTPELAQFVFLEVLLSLASALTKVKAGGGMEDRINGRIVALIKALEKLLFPRKSLPEWVSKDFTDTQLFWFATALTAFYDEGV